MAEGQPLPQPDPVTSAQETGNPGGVGGFITSLVERRIADPRYSFPEVKMYDLLSDLMMETSRNEYPDVERNLVTNPAYHDTVVNVFTGFGSLIFDRLPANKQAVFLGLSRQNQEARGGDLELTEEEGNVLKNIAHSVGIDYDPGNAENIQKRTFRFADIEKKTPDPSMVDFPFTLSLHPKTSSQ